MGGHKIHQRMALSSICDLVGVQSQYPRKAPPNNDCGQLVGGRFLHMPIRRLSTGSVESRNGQPT